MMGLLQPLPAVVHQPVIQPTHPMRPAAAAAAAQGMRRPRGVKAAAAAGAASATALAADPYTQLAGLCGAHGAVAVGNTPRGRGLVLKQDMPAREAVLTVPLHNALIIADEPTDGISIFSDRQHRRWQELHGPLPPMLLEFLQGDARWDARMAAWLLWMTSHPSHFWRSYLDLLPAESDMSCLLNFSQAEAAELQVPALQEEASIQARWCAHLHASFFSSTSGSLAPLRLSDSLAHSLWALALVRSRTFSEDVNGEALTLVVPYADMANHCSSHNSTFCISKDFKSFSLRSLRPLQQGEELTISYGAEKPNAEALRDYGFVLSGNRHDRIAFGIPGAAAGTAAAAKGAAGAAAAADAAKEAVAALFGLNEACLMEAVGFTGDLAGGEIQPLPAVLAAASTPEQQQQLARREAAVLSMPLKRPNSSSSNGGLFGWLTEASQPWTESGRPPPQPLRRDQAAAERASVHALQQQLRQQLAALPSSIQTDQALLSELEHPQEAPYSNSISSSITAAAGGLSSGSSNGSRSGSSSGSSSSDSSSVRQRRRARLQQGSVVSKQQPPAAAADAAAGATATGAVAGASTKRAAVLHDSRPLSVARIKTAVRARLEHKLLLQEGLSVLQQYGRYLADRFGAA